MPVAPLFVVDENNLNGRDELLRRLRLSDACSTDAQEIIDQAIEEVRVRLYDEVEGLGPTRVAEILAIPYVENATSADDLLRTCANLLEVVMVRRQLLCTMPVLFMDGSGVSPEVWNEEPLTRNSFDEVQEQIRKLDQEIASKMEALRGDPCEQGVVDVSVFGPPANCPPPRPGDSLIPRRAGVFPY